MPRRRLCSYPGCRRLVTEKFCEPHIEKDAAYWEKHNALFGDKRTAFGRKKNMRYKDPRWEPMRQAHLSLKWENRLCASCGIAPGHPEIDHIVPHNDQDELFFNMDNLQTLCKSCHSKKTGKEKRGR